MPLPVTPWAAGTPPTAKSLDLAMYTIDGSLNKPNGIAFHARRPMTAEVLDDVVTLAGSSSGSRTVIDQSSKGHYDATQICDNAGYYGQTSDGSFPLCAYHLAPVVAGSAGDGVTPGGVTIIGHTLPASGAGSSFNGLGADLFKSGTLYSSGARQQATPGHDTITYFLDLVDTTGGTWQPSAFVDDSGGNSATTTVNATDSSGETPRFFTIWAGVSAVNQAAYGTPQSPAPFTSFTAATTVDVTLANGADVNLNGPNGIAGPLNFLSNPPLMRASLKSSQSIPATTATQVTLSAAPDLDPYSGWVSQQYTVPRNGLYLAHALVPYSSHSGGARQAGIAVNGTVYWGPAYPGSGNTSVCCTKTQVFDLAFGDVVQIWTRQSASGSVSLSNSDQARLFLTWLGVRGAPASPWTPPNPGFSWQAGSPGASLPGLFQQHVANDLGFLTTRPYFLGYQKTAQAGLGNNSQYTVTFDTASGIVHATNGDNYGGWTAGPSNAYAAQASGWYLAVMETFATFPSTTSSPALTALFTVPTSGGRAPGQTSDRYQQIFPPTSGSWNPGTTAVGLYYLLQGETITPQLLAQSWTSGTWGTSVSTGQNSHLELVWISE